MREVENRSWGLVESRREECPMVNATVTISALTLERLRDLAKRKGVTVEQALDLAVKDQHDRAF